MPTTKTVTLAKLLSHCFGSRDRRRGSNLQWHNSVTITAAGTQGVLALVNSSSGGLDYIVALDFSEIENGRVGTHCECPQFQKGFQCKHLWAVIEHIDANFEPFLPNLSRVSLFDADAGTIETGESLVQAAPKSRRRDRDGRSGRVQNASPAKKRFIAAIENGSKSQRSLAAGAPTRDGTGHKVKGRQESERSKETRRRAANATQSSKAPGKVKSAGQTKSKVSDWKLILKQMAAPVADGQRDENTSSMYSLVRSVEQAQYWYLCSVGANDEQSSLSITVLSAIRKSDGQWGRPTVANLSGRQPFDGTAEDKLVLDLLPIKQTNGYRYYQDHCNHVREVNSSLLRETLRAMMATNRLAWKLGVGTRHFEDATPINQLDLDGEWTLSLKVSPCSEKSSQLRLQPQLVRNGHAISMNDLMGVWDQGCALVQVPTRRSEPAVTGNSEGMDFTAAPAVDDSPQQAADQLQAADEVTTRMILVDPSQTVEVRRWRKTPTLAVPKRSLKTMLDQLALDHAHVPIELDPELGVEEATAVPRGHCALTQQAYKAPRFDMVLSARYDDHLVALSDATRWWWDRKRSTVLHRDRLAEANLKAQLPDDKVERWSSGLTIDRQDFLHVAEHLRGCGWEVIAEGAPLRVASDFDVSVSSGVDWFDLDGGVQFDEMSVALPMLLAALRNGDQSIVLDDGSIGMLPTDWLKKFVGIETSGEQIGDSFRFKSNQALLLDAMLQEVQATRRDDAFVGFLEQLRSFDGIAATDPPKSFRGTMRDYQRLGLGWFQFLQQFKFGGCLADDMGLGKTIQVLALLDRRRVDQQSSSQTKKPSIAIVPKSLVFNWIDEASKFTPELSIVNYTGTQRREVWANAFDQNTPDVIVTTYGTLRNDIGDLRNTEFDYVILDEAQAVKNPASLSAKSVRLLEGNHRLAMTGTPIENHLGDLWSLFEFLNPGMLGKNARTVAHPASLDDEQQRKRLDQISHSLRPFILRRTKSEVLTELPSKSEQTLSCDMTRGQAKVYRELKEHYRTHLSEKLKELGLKRSKIHVLEALLRLRQVACDPRLVQPDCGVVGAKMQTLMEQLSSLIQEGHKALVFSQFTSLLSLVRRELDQQGHTYEYLDGKTRKRAEKVARFQEDPDCSLFLISLKAGGNGLNLTAADYVFIMDPWWNPAVEAQAIDRAHRMGQTKSVMAYRMITSGTVEDKIIELQQNKRDLAQAIISDDKSLISSLTAADLQSLLD
ncbi:MAG: SNF2-related protein [Planctomycetota bacterium]